MSDQHENVFLTFSFLINVIKNYGYLFVDVELLLIKY